MIALCVSAVLAWASPAAAVPSWLPPQRLTATDSETPVVAVAPDGTTVAPGRAGRGDAGGRGGAAPARAGGSPRP